MVELVVHGKLHHHLFRSLNFHPFSPPGNFTKRNPTLPMGTFLQVVLGLHLAGDEFRYSTLALVQVGWPGLGPRASPMKKGVFPSLWFVFFLGGELRDYDRPL